MRYVSLSTVLATCFLVLQSTAVGGTVQVSMTVDDPELLLGETTTLHVSAQVLDGAAENGVFAYALNILADSPSIVDIRSVQQLGEPDAFLSSPGIALSGSLRDVYGGDGGFFQDKNRGIGAPFELLSIQIQGVGIGQADYTATVADQAEFLGIASGFLLQQPGGVISDFGSGVSITVIPEPASLALLLVGAASFVCKRRHLGRLRL